MVLMPCYLFDKRFVRLNGYANARLQGFDAYGKMLQQEKARRIHLYCAFSAPELERKAKELGCIAFLQSL